MQKTSIEWVKNPEGSLGYTWNPITGCLNHENGLCKGGGFPCYAYKLANGRLKQRYLANKELAPVHYDTYKRFDGELSQTVVTRAFQDPFYPRFWEERLDAPIEHPTPLNPAKRKGIFVCDMGELFGEWIPQEWQEQIFTTIKLCPYHRFYLLTKQPQNLITFSPFPDNTWVGVTATNNEMALDASANLAHIKASIKFISFEPLLGHIGKAILDLLTDKRGINWLIIGACTGSWVDMANLCMKHTNSLSNYAGLTLTQWGNKWTLQPKIEWVREIVEVVDKAGIPVFLKDNLKPMFDQLPTRIMLNPGMDWAKGENGMRQEMPK